MRKKDFSSNISLLEELMAIIGELQECSKANVPIVVEGPNDREALRELGVKGDIFLVSGSPGTLTVVAERLAKRYEKALILTDFDQTGEKTAKDLANHLKALDVVVDLEVRRQLIQLVSKDITNIEALASFVDKIRREIWPRQ